MVGVAGDEHLALAGLGPGDGDASGRDVGSVLRKQRPIGVAHGLDVQFRQLDHAGRGPVEAVAEPALPVDGLLDLGMAEPEQVGPVAAHEIDVLVAVDVHDATAVAALEELRIALGKHCDIAVPVHASRNHTPRALAQSGVLGIALLHHDPVSSPCCGRGCLRARKATSSNTRSKIVAASIYCIMSNRSRTHGSGLEFAPGAGVGRWPCSISRLGVGRDRRWAVPWTSSIGRWAGSRVSSTTAYRPGPWAKFLRAAEGRPRPERLMLADQASRVSDKLHRRGHPLAAPSPPAARGLDHPEVGYFAVDRPSRRRSR